MTHHTIISDAELDSLEAAEYFENKYTIRRLVAEVRRARGALKACIASAQDGAAGIRSFDGALRDIYNYATAALPKKKTEGSHAD